VQVCITGCAFLLVMANVASASHTKVSLGASQVCYSVFACSYTSLCNPIDKDEGKEEIFKSQEGKTKTAEIHELSGFNQYCKGNRRRCIPK
jgi:hypothetical protein